MKHFNKVLDDTNLIDIVYGEFLNDTNISSNEINKFRILFPELNDKIYDKIYDKNDKLNFIKVQKDVGSSILLE